MKAKNETVQSEESFWSRIGKALDAIEGGENRQVWERVSAIRRDLDQAICRIEALEDQKFQDSDHCLVGRINQSDCSQAS